MPCHNLLGHPYDQMTKEQIAKSVKVRAARANALKSSGPRTPEGKAIAARNAFKHGFAGAKLFLDVTEQVAFNDHLDAYFLRFKPQDQVEADSVRRIAEAQWKMDIINATENSIMALEGGWQMCLADAKLDPEQVTVHHYRALAIIEQSQGRALDLCHRYYVSASREFDRSLKTFYKLREERPNDAKQQLVPELLPQHPEPVAPSPQEPAAAEAAHQTGDESPENVKKPNEPTAPSLVVVEMTSKPSISNPDPGLKKAA
jgi:hypothetical protein